MPGYSRTMETVTVRVPRELVLNSNDRMHYAPRAKRTAALRLLGAAAWRSAAIDPREGATIYVGCWYRDRRRRDSGNGYPMYKALVDGFVDAGAIPDDDNEHLLGPWSFGAGVDRSIGSGVVLVFEIHPYVSMG